MRDTVRKAICMVCAQRPAGSEALGHSVARVCEPRCAVFRHLDDLKYIAETASGGSLGRYDLSVRHTLCDRLCGLRTPARSAGEPCRRDTEQVCVLSRFSGQVLQVLETLAHPDDVESLRDAM